jgi:AAA15 family ATPase/GTPase
MEYVAFHIRNYRAIRDPVTLDLADKPLVPLVGINECGKTTILQAVFAFDYVNDAENDGKHLENTLNLYQTQEPDPLVSADIRAANKELATVVRGVIETSKAPSPSPHFSHS